VVPHREAWQFNTQFLLRYVELQWCLKLLLVEKVIVGEFISPELWKSTDPDEIISARSEIVSKYISRHRNRMIDAARHSVHSPFYKSRLDENCMLPQNYVNCALPVKIAGLIARLRSNSLKIYVNDKSVSRSFICPFCDVPAENNWDHIMSVCPATAKARTKHCITKWFDNIRSNERDFCLRIWNFFAEILECL